MLDRRTKQNHKEENLLALHQELFPLKEGIGLILKQGNILLSEYEVSKKSNIFFYVIHNKCIEKKTERFNSGE